MNELELRYRQALRWYPKDWRVANEDAVLGTLLDVAEGDRRVEPARGEIANLYRTGLAARFEPLSRLLTATARGHASILALGLGASISAAGILFGSLTYQFANRIYEQVFSVSGLLQSLSSGQGVYVFWIVAFVAALLGWRRVALITLFASIPVSIVWTAIALALSDYGHPSDVSLGFLALLAIVAASGLTTQGGRYRTPLAVSAGTFTALLAGSFWLRTYGGGDWGTGARYIDYFWSPLAVWLVLAGIPLALTAAIIFSRLRMPDRATGVLFAASPLLPLGLFAFGWQHGDPNIAEVLISVIVAVALGIGALRLFGLRIRITRV